MRPTDERSSSTHWESPYRRADESGRPRGGDAGTDPDRERTDADGRDGGPVCPGSLIVVSNRQPYRHEYESDGGVDAGNGTDADPSITVDEPTGGLTAGLDPVVQRTDGTWIAWGDGDADFDVADENGCVAVPPGEEAYTLRRIDLPDEAIDSYYYGFSNRVLWPLCHGFPELVEDRANDFEWYRTVNEQFADAVVEHADEDSVVWFQDYHFALAPRMVRNAVAPGTTVAQFWHVPWPDPSTFRYCPAGGNVLEGLLGNDLLGFHVDRYVDRFLESVERFLPAARVDRKGRTVHYEGTTTRVVATPMGVDAASYDREAREVGAGPLESLRSEYDVPHPDDAVIGLGVDRLDYTKGIPERLAALERFFERYPDWRGEFTFVQKATLSRTDIPTYERHGDLVRSEVERINSRFGTDDWQPVIYTEDYLEQAELCALYRHADLLLVSPLVDGMNLVAQEYVAASVDDTGDTLLLSDRVGAHDLLGSHAITIDPSDIDGMAERIADALEMPIDERRRRMRTLRDRVFDADIERWMSAQFDWMRRLHGEPSRSGRRRQEQGRGRNRPCSDSGLESDSRSGMEFDADPGSDSGSDSDSDPDLDSDHPERTPPA
ncbi:trehalose 6-phosphate synthase [Halobiforma haloterrestris]|uniref:Trehalose 6-phosphate synthase n=1 Tax=Natronobacterium haloterrestre TaxID=148448 RepID=A0A1I1F4E7_NATHA|nr:trehalose-6-phosphate synthase [Halobiforma haloterrestris]SFB94339.1 trehalose 6-phosphate synthase [Halobiforma haloterrestris]